MAYVQNPPQESPTDIVEFLQSLPQDDFLEAEELLREAILTRLNEKKQRNVEQVMSDPPVAAQMKAFFPPAMKGMAKMECLVDWMERRIGGEVEVVRTKKGTGNVKTWMVRIFGDKTPILGGKGEGKQGGKGEGKKGGKEGGKGEGKKGKGEAQAAAAGKGKAAGGKGKASKAPQGASPDQWFATLPDDDFLWEEERLRDGIFDFLAAWRRPEIATVWMLEMDPTVRGMCAALMPPGVRLLDWIDRRIGAEVVIGRDGGVQLQGEAVVIVQEKYMEVERRLAYGMPPPGAAWGPPPGPPGWGPPPHGGPVVPKHGQSFAGGMDELPKSVVPLRKSIEKARSKNPQAFEERMTMSDLNRLMGQLGVKFDMGRVSAVAKEVLGINSPAEIIRRYCADLVKLGGATKHPYLKEKGRAHADKQELTEEQERKREQKQARKAAKKAEKRALKDAQGEGAGNDDDDVSQDGDGEDKTPEALWAKLPPPPGLWAQEQKLKKHLFNMMAHRQQADEGSQSLLLEDALANATIKRMAASLLGKYDATLQEWIERRLPDEVAVGIDEEDRPALFALVPMEATEPDIVVVPSKAPADSEDARLQKSKTEKAQVIQDFLTLLPEGGLSDGERLLAEKLAEFDGENLSKAQADVTHEKKTLLEELYGRGTKVAKLPFKKWIETRCSDIITLAAGNGQPVICAVGGQKRKHDESGESSPAKMAKR